MRETIFGGFWEFPADLTKADTAYTNLELHPHTDGTYCHDAPGLQISHCPPFHRRGRLLDDGRRVPHRRRTAAGAPDHYDALSTVEMPGQYVGDGSHPHGLPTCVPSRPLGSLVQVSFNNADRAPFLLPPDEMVPFYDALRASDLLANDAPMQWRRVTARARRCCSTTGGYCTVEPRTPDTVGCAVHT